MPRRVYSAGVALLLSTLLIQPSARADFVGSYRQDDASLVALNILPPGQGHHLSPFEAPSAFAGSHPAHNVDQIGKYSGLIGAIESLNDSNLPDWFTDASFGVMEGDVERSYNPGGRSTLVVLRDKSKGVPHVYGKTRSDVMFGTGYVSAEDRLFAMDALRHLGRGRLSELLGASPSNLASDRAVRLAADYTEEELEQMGNRLANIDPARGTQARQDLLDYAAGINQFINETVADPRKLPAIYPAIQQTPRPWRMTDSIAIAAYIGGVFSVGGGGQLRNSLFIDKLLQQDISYAEARTIMRDLKFENDPEAPVSTTTPFPFNDTLGPPNPASLALPDDPEAVLAQITAMPQTFDTPLGPVQVPLAAAGASNALLVTADKSASGRPLAVFGPQVGYFSPEIFMEMDVHGPGIHARGGAFPGISLYVLIGRGTDYAWSATTAIGDHNDIRAVKLCNPGGGPVAQDSGFYLKDGVCTPMYRRTDTWLAKPSAGGTPETLGSAARTVVSMMTERTIHGIVQARGTVDSEPVAFVRQRSSYMADVDSTLTYVDLMNPEKVEGVESLQQLFGRFNYSFNWHLIAKDGVGFYTTGKYPKLAQGVDADLPFWGDSSWDWQGFLGFEEHPQAFNPSSGYIGNWNNKQAPSFRSADDWWAYGPVGRKSLLDDGVGDALSDGKVSLVELVSAMGLGATRDIRGAKVLPSMLEVVGAPSTDRLQDAVDLLSGWSSGGAHRRDVSGDGKYEDRAAVLLMDAWWNRAIEAIFRPSLGSALDAIPVIWDDKPGPGGSSYLEGMYGQVQKDLRGILGQSQQGAFSRTYCGAGSLSLCRQRLTSSLDAALSSLESRYGADPDLWGIEEEEDDTIEARDSIEFSGLDLTGPGRMPWQNRPTFQQVLSF